MQASFRGVGPRHIQIAAPPDGVWAVLANARRYSDWVAGARAVRDADPGWPAVGRKLHHTVGVWPLVVNDETVVVESEPPRRLVLRASVKPVGRFRVELGLEAADGGTRVTMQEFVESGPARFTGPLGDAGAQTRMEISLRRLKRLVETGA